MEEIEIDLFLYDKWQIKESLQRFFKAEILEHRPAFANAKLYKVGTKYHRQIHLIKSNRYDKIIFGTFVKIKLTERDLQSFLLIANQEEKQLESINIRTFEFKNLDEFLKNKIVLKEWKKCYTLVSQKKDIEKRRQRDIGNFEKNFLITY